MISGVLIFYILIGNMNSMISVSIRKELAINKNITRLDKIGKLYSFEKNFLKSIHVELLADRRRLGKEDFFKVFRQLPSILRKELKFHMYINDIGYFPLFTQVNLDTICQLGDCLTKSRFLAGKFFLTNRQDHLPARTDCK